MVEMVDYDNTEDQVLLEGIVKSVIEQFLKKSKIEFYTGEIDDVESLEDDIKNHGFKEGDKRKTS